MANGDKESITSCSYKLHEDLRIEIPESSRLSSHLVSKAPVTFPHSFINRVANPKLVDCFGFAVDLGTTTIAIYLCNIGSGKVLSSTAVKNPQALYGDDVISRISAIGKDRDNLVNMQQLAVRAIEWGMRELQKSCGIARGDIAQAVVVGNPTMIHILAGIDPTPIGISPYRPAFTDSLTISANELGFNFFGTVNLRTLPMISGFVGGDTIAAALAIDIDRQPPGTLLVDLGTNGELLLKGNGKLYAASCATGPAFEGASISCGIQAIPGAVNKVVIEELNKYPKLTIINSKGSPKNGPLGVCGTGVISVIAELCRKHIIEANGAFRKEITIEPLQRDNEQRPYYLLLDPESSQNGFPLFITQKDIRSVQLGKGALITGIELLLSEAGYEKPEKIIIAGAFGTFIEKEDMITLGMLPDIVPDRIVLLWRVEIFEIIS